jgi:LacI family transcriptional regulator
LVNISEDEKAAKVSKRSTGSQKTGASKSANKKLSSIYDLAKQTGLSTSTISRVLNQRGRISEKTRLQVLAAARAAGFKPRAAVRRRTVALVVDRMRYAIYGGFVPITLSQLICEMARYDITAEIYTEDNVDQLGTRFVDGVIALTWDQQTLEKLQSLESVPVVLVNRQGVDAFSSVATDHALGGHLAGEHFIQNGHMKIALIAEEDDWGFEQRVAGLRAAMSEAGISAENLFVGVTDHQPLHQTLTDLLAKKPTALVIAGEDITIQAMHELTSLMHISIPDDLSVIGMEVSCVSEYIDPPLTTLAQPLDQLASEVLALLHESINSNDTVPRQVMIGTTLIPRISIPFKL